GEKATALRRPTGGGTWAGSSAASGAGFSAAGIGCDRGAVHAQLRAGKRCAQRVLQGVTRRLPARLGLQQIEPGAGGRDAGGQLLAAIDRSELQSEPGLPQLLLCALEPPLRRILVLPRDRLGPLGGGNLTIDLILQRQHALPGQLA